MCGAHLTPSVPPASLVGGKGRNGGGGGGGGGKKRGDAGDAGDTVADTTATADTTSTVESPAAAASDDSADAAETSATDEEGGGAKKGKRHGAACQPHTRRHRGRCASRPVRCLPWQVRETAEVEAEAEEARTSAAVAPRRMQWRRSRWATQPRHRAEGGVGSYPFRFSVPPERLDLRLLY